MPPVRGALHDGHLPAWGIAGVGVGVAAEVGVPQLGQKACPGDNAAPQLRQVPAGAGGGL